MYIQIFFNIYVSNLFLGVFMLLLCLCVLVSCLCLSADFDKRTLGWVLDKQLMAFGGHFPWSQVLGLTIGQVVLN